MVSITIASYRMPGKKIGATLSGSVDAIKIVCLPYNSPEIRTGADYTMKKLGAIAKFRAIKNKKTYVCYIKFYAHKDIKNHAGTYTCAAQLNQPSNCKLTFSSIPGAEELRTMWTNLQEHAVMFDKLKPAAAYLKEDPTVEEIPVYMGPGPVITSF